MDEICLEHRCVFFQSVPFSSYSAKGLCSIKGDSELLVGRFLPLVQEQTQVVTTTSVSQRRKCTHDALCPCSGYNFHWKIQVCLNLRRSDKEVSWGKEKAS